MSRISIDVTDAEHQKLKAMAALQGKTIKEFVLASTLGQAKPDDEKALHELEELLDRRLQRAQTEGYSTRTVEDIFQQAIDGAIEQHLFCKYERVQDQRDSMVR